MMRRLSEGIIHWSLAFFTRCRWVALVDERMFSVEYIVLADYLL